MRTSRVSRETAQAVDALSPARRNARRSVRGFANTIVDAQNGEESSELKGSENAASTLLSTPDAEAKTLGKRKRSTQTAPTPADSSVTTVRRSPRQGDSAVSRKPRRQPAKHIKGPNGALTIEPPLNWEKVYNITASMRKRVLAPVDTMGCESLAEEHRSPQDQRLQTLIALMLSSQTKDTVTAAAMKNLQENLPGGFTLDSLLKISPEDLNNLISKVGFHNNKTKFIKSVALILHTQYNGDIPSTISGLTSLPGVGPKMAYLCMSAAWGRDEGIGVDVHVHRITNLWGWHKTSTPEQTRVELEAWLPREKWHGINNLLVGFGQTVCLPVGRKCGECDLAGEGLCPSAVVTETKKREPVKKKVRRGMDLEVNEGEVGTVKVEEVVVQADDVGVKMEADLKDEGKIEVQGLTNPTSGGEEESKLFIDTG